MVNTGSLLSFNDITLSFFNYRLALHIILRIIYSGSLLIAHCYREFTVPDYCNCKFLELSLQ